MELLFALAILVAVGAVVARKVRQGPMFREDARPRVVAGYAEIDDALPRRCPCGGRFEKQGEDSTKDGVRVVVVCGRCERRRALRFRVAS